VTVIVTRTVSLVDPLARANVVDALRGPGAPIGVLTVDEDGADVLVRFDDAISQPELIDDLIAIESVLVPAKTAALGEDAAAAIAAAGLGDPELDARRSIEAAIRELPR
jgi:hypothetical protein